MLTRRFVLPACCLVALSSPGCKPYEEFEDPVVASEPTDEGGARGAELSDGWGMPPQPGVRGAKRSAGDLVGRVDDYQRGVIEEADE